MCENTLPFIIAVVIIAAAIVLLGRIRKNSYYMGFVPNKSDEEPSIENKLDAYYEGEVARQEAAQLVALRTGGAKPIVYHNGIAITPRAIDVEKLVHGMGRAECEFGARVVVDALQEGNEWRIFNEDDLMESDFLHWYGSAPGTPDEERKRLGARSDLKFLLNDGWIVRLPNPERDDKRDNGTFNLSPFGLFPDDRFEVTEMFVIRCAYIVGLIESEKALR